MPSWVVSFAYNIDDLKNYLLVNGLNKLNIYMLLNCQSKEKKTLCFNTESVVSRLYYDLWWLIAKIKRSAAVQEFLDWIHEGWYVWMPIQNNQHKYIIKQAASTIPTAIYFHKLNLAEESLLSFTPGISCECTLFICTYCNVYSFR